MADYWNRILWDQLGASIDMLENAIAACPDQLWSDPAQKPEYRTHEIVGFWHVVYHTVFFLDLQLSLGVVEGFAPPAPFDLSELDPEGLLPERPYTKDEVRFYLHHCREKGRATFDAFTEEDVRRPCKFGSMELTFGELMVYGIRHVQHHAGQLHLLLRQNTGAAPRYVKRAAEHLPA